MRKFNLFVILFFINVFMFRISAAQNAESFEKSKNVLRYGSVIGLKKEFEERYIILHKYTFPGVLERLRKCNIRNYSIFLKDGILFSHFEYTGSDFDADMAAMADDVTRDWWKLTDPMQEPLDGRKEGEWWASAELLFQMDSIKITGPQVQRGVFKGILKAGRKEAFKNRLNKMTKAVLKAYLDHNFQNLTFYVFGGCVYFYYEYTGNDFRGDRTSLFSIEAIKAVDSELKAMLQPDMSTGRERTWIPMQEVFHTD